MDKDAELEKMRLENEKLKRQLEEQKHNHHHDSEKHDFIKFKYIIMIVALLIVGGIGYYLYSTGMFEKVTEEKLDIDTLKNNVVFIMNYDSKGNLASVGSGVYINENTIFTNYHVIENADSLDVSLDDNTKVKVLGIKASDKKSDIAILMTDNISSVKKLNFNNSLKTGEGVIAIGNPLGIKNVVSDGIYSGEYSVDEMTVYQHTAPISPGSSGGALFNSKGELVAINFASYVEGQNLNLAIKIEDFNKMYNDSINNSLVPVKTTNFFSTSLAKNGSKVFSEFCKFDNSCDGIENYEYDFIKSEEYALIKDSVEYYETLDASSNYEKIEENKYESWVRVFIFKIKNNNDELYSNFKKLVNYKAIETRDNYPGLTFDIYYSRNNDYYYYIEYKNYDIKNVTEALESL